MHEIRCRQDPVKGSGWILSPSTMAERLRILRPMLSEIFRKILTKITDRIKEVTLIFNPDVSVKVDILLKIELYDGCL